MMGEIMHSKYETVVPCTNKVGIILYKTKRLLHSHHLRSSVFDISLGKRIWKSVIDHLRNPETIFGRNEK